MQSTVQQEDRQAGLSDLGAVLPHDTSAPVMLEPPDLHVDPVERAMSLAAELPPPDPALRAAPVNDNVAPTPPARRGGFARGVARALLAIAVGAAATVGWLSYGEAARQLWATWAPQLVAAAPAPTQDTKLAVQQAPASIGTVEQQPPAQLAAIAATPALENVAASPPVQAAPAPDPTPKLEEMAREIASLRETIDQLKTGQQQLSRELARAVEQESRRKTAAASPPPVVPKPAAAAPRNPPLQPAYAPPPPQRQVYVPPREQVYVEPPPPPRVYTPPPPQVYTPPPQVYVPPPTYYDGAAPRPPRPLP